jgi:hypothetical protein
VLLRAELLRLLTGVPLTHKQIACAFEVKPHKKGKGQDFAVIKEEMTKLLGELRMVYHTFLNETTYDMSHDASLCRHLVRLCYMLATCWLLVTCWLLLTYSMLVCMLLQVWIQLGWSCRCSLCSWLLLLTTAEAAAAATAAAAAALPHAVAAAAAGPGVSALHSSLVSSGTGFQVSGQPSIPVPCGIAAASAFHSFPCYSCHSVLLLPFCQYLQYCDRGRWC